MNVCITAAHLHRIGFELRATLTATLCLSAFQSQMCLHSPNPLLAVMPTIFENSNQNVFFMYFDSGRCFRAVAYTTLAKPCLFYDPSGLTSRILTCTELKGHCFVLVSGYVC